MGTQPTGNAHQVKGSTHSSRVSLLGRDVSFSLHDMIDIFFIPPSNSQMRNQCRTFLELVFVDSTEWQ